MKSPAQEDIRKVQSLFNACMAGDLDGVKLILSNKIHNVNGDIIDEKYSHIHEIDPKEWGRRPIHVAVIAGHYEILKFLVEQGADIDIKSKYGDTALHFAVHHNRFKIFTYLLSKRADPHITNNVHLSVLDIAKEQEKSVFIKEIEKLT